MARRRIPDIQKSKPSSGLLSNVLSFVSREFESFVLNATSVGPVNQPVSTGRVKSSGRRCRRDSEGNMSEGEARYTSRAQHHRERGERRSKRKLSRPKPRSKSTDSTGKHRYYINLDDDQALSASDRERSKSPTPRPPTMFPVPQPPKLKKQPSLTMPGSLFPRSPSLLPDQPDRYKRTQAASGVPIFVQPSHPYDNDPDEAEAGPSSTHSSTIPSTDFVHPNQSSLDQYASPWRTRSVASVKDAVHRFNATEGAEADFSLMLPSPHASPVKPASTARSVDEASPHRPTSSSAAPFSTSRKGKERARDSGHDLDLDFILCGSSEHDGVYAKERELDAAREEQREHERRLSGDQSRRASDGRERDKWRIKALEEEVRWLKEELSKSQARSSPPPSLAPPPPPPPPPPLPLRIDTAPCTPTSMFATARASLRHAMTPVEAPINNPGPNRTKRRGKPTVNVPSEKMAAFLHEIKTAKLRRVGSGANANAMGGDGVAGPSGLSKSVSVTASSASTIAAKLSAKELLRRRSLANLRVPIGSSLAAPVPLSALATPNEPEVRVGQKRKVDALGVDDVTDVPSKRRMTQSSSQSSSGMSQQTAASSSEILPLSSLSLPSRPLPTNETDVTTPSLCSDNDRDENSIEDRTPLTPPRPRTTTVTRKASKADAREEQIEVIDVEMAEHSHLEPRTIGPDSVPRRTSDLFKKRPPTSPIPIPTPRRPSAPARTKRGATPKPKSLPSLESDVDDEDEALSQSAPVPYLSLIPIAKSKPSKPKAKPTLPGKGRPRAALQQQNGHPSTSSSSGSSSQNKRKKVHKRRQTLDEELRTAEARSSELDQCNDELDPEEEDVFIATGTKSKWKGFLAHGGGGGAPVFMGAGYVQGAVLDSADEDGVTRTQLRRPPKSANQASFIPRPKART